MWVPFCIGLLDMNIGRIYYPVKVLGYGNRIGIWVCGCNQDCQDCASPELRNASNGMAITTDEIMTLVNGINEPIDGVTISGGEPFLQVDELAVLVDKFIQRGIDDIIIYTGYIYETLLKYRATKEILNNISVLIDGSYISRLDDGIGIRGSSNQKIHIFRYYDRYKNAVKCKRQMQTIVMDTHITYIGKPNEREKI